MRCSGHCVRFAALWCWWFGGFGGGGCGEQTECLQVDGNNGSMIL